MVFERLRNNFQLGIIVLFGAIAFLAIAPFAVYRFVSGNVLAGSVDLGILAGIVAGVVYAWNGGNLRRTGLVIMLIATTGGLIIAKLLGIAGLLWLHPILLANFLLVDRGKAFAIAVLALLVLVLEGSVFSSGLEEWMFLSTASVTILFSMLFASRTESQRIRLESLAVHDVLTGAQNRLAMEQALQALTAGRREADADAGIAILDLDHFKEVNDRFGHEAGDRVLADFCRLVRRYIRRGDELYRYGGEEFVLLLPGIETGGLGRVAEDVRAGIARDLRHADARITVSIGVAMRTPGEDYQACLARADAAMYRAKRSGRNRVEMA